MAQQSNTIDLIIQDANGQPQLIKVQNPHANKQIVTTGLRTLSGQPVRVIKSGSQVSQVVSGNNTMLIQQPIYRPIQGTKPGQRQIVIQSGNGNQVTLKQPQEATVITKQVQPIPQQNVQVIPSAPASHKPFVGPMILDRSGGRKRQEIDMEFVPEYKRRKTEKGGKGLRHFSMKVCEKVRKKGVTSYNEVADELVAEFTNPAHISINNPDQQYDQKNIRRRVYDALNVLMAMNIISKEKKLIKWLGLPTNSIQECLDLVKEKKDLTERIRSKTHQLNELLMQQISFKCLVERNKLQEEKMGMPAPNTHIQLPFIVVTTSKKTVIDCSISNDKSEYLFSFNDKFEINDDFEVLKKMGLVLGLDKGQCTEEDLKKAKSLVPKSLERYVTRLATGLKDYDMDGAGPSSMVMVEMGAQSGDTSQPNSLFDPTSPSQEFSDEDSDAYSDVEIN